MKYFFCLFLIPQITWAAAESLVGTWKFTNLIYQNQIFPLPNPDLNLRWTFFQNGTERLYWDHGNVGVFCERWGFYSLQESILREEGFALNPKNSPDCGKDPDMQLPRITYTRLEWNNGKIHLYLKAGSEDLIYALELQP